MALTRLNNGSTGGGVRSSTRMINGFPDRYRTFLTYTERVTVTSTTGATATYRFAGNGLFDPNITGTGAQPINYDAFSAQYGKYRCHGSKISLVCPNSAGTVSADVVLYPENSTTSIAIEEALGQPYAKSIFGANYAGGGNPVITSGITSGKVLGRNVREFEGSDLTAAAYTANPSDIWYWTILFNSTDRSTTLSAAPFTVKIVYDVEFFDRFPSVLSFETLTLEQVREMNLKLRGRSAEEKGDKKDEDGDWSMDSEPCFDAGDRKGKAPKTDDCDTRSVLSETNRKLLQHSEQTLRGGAALWTPPISSKTPRASAGALLVR